MVCTTTAAAAVGLRKKRVVTNLRVVSHDGAHSTALGGSGDAVDRGPSAGGKHPAFALVVGHKTILQQRIRQATHRGCMFTSRRQREIVQVNRSNTQRTEAAYNLPVLLPELCFFGFMSFSLGREWGLPHTALQLLQQIRGVNDYNLQRLLCCCTTKEAQRLWLCQPAGIFFFFLTRG